MLMTEYDYDTDIAVQREEAYEDGLSKGLQQGINQGAYEKAVETAKSMLSDNLNTRFIVKYTNLPLETIQQLEKDLE